MQEQSYVLKKQKLCVRITKRIYSEARTVIRIEGEKEIVWLQTYYENKLHAPERVVISVK